MTRVDLLTTADLIDALYDLIDRSDDTSETVPAGRITNCAVAGVTMTAPALAGTVGVPPLRWAVKNNATDTLTISYPDYIGTPQTIIVLPGGAIIFRQKTASGWGVESGNEPVESMDNRYVIVGSLW
jgi:hypothetical protein